MMGALLDQTIQYWQRDGWQIDILKTNAPIKPRSGVNYYYQNILPREGVNYKEVWLGMKPQQILNVADNVSRFLDKNTLAVSILAGVPSSTIAKIFDVEMVIRAMPNINSGVIGDDGRGNGQTALTSFGNINKERFDRIISDFARAGEVYSISEDKMNSFTAVAGSGPAYAYHLFGVAYRFLRESANFSKKDATKLVLDVARRRYSNPLNSEKVKNALLQIDKSKGSFEGIVFEAGKALENCSAEELACFISGVINSFSEALVKGSMSLGFDREISSTIICGPRGIIRGSALAAEKTEKTFLELKNAVTSVNGTTQAALGVIEVGAGRSLNDLCEQGLKAACDRGKELGNSLDFVKMRICDNAKICTNH